MQICDNFYFRSDSFRQLLRGSIFEINDFQGVTYNISPPTPLSFETSFFVFNGEVATIHSNQEQNQDLPSFLRSRHSSCDILFYTDPLKLSLKAKNLNESRYSTVVLTPEREEYSLKSSSNSISFQVFLLTVSLILKNKRKIINQWLRKVKSKFSAFFIKSLKKKEKEKVLVHLRGGFHFLFLGSYTLYVYALPWFLISLIILILSFWYRFLAPFLAQLKLLKKLRDFRKKLRDFSSFFPSFFKFHLNIGNPNYVKNRFKHLPISVLTWCAVFAFIFLYFYTCFQYYKTVAYEASEKY